MIKFPKQKFNKNFILLFISFLLIFYFIISKPVYKPQLQFSEHVKGSQNAPVSIVVYGEYQCVRTRNFWNQIVPKLEEDYINSGKAKLIYKYHPKVFYNNSLKAAEATECAADQGKFWEYNELIFERMSSVCDQPGLGLGLSDFDLKKYAEEINLNTKLFNACLDSEVMLPRIQANMDELHEKGMRSSGIVYINGELISGNSPYSEFQAKIENFLNQTSKNQ